MAVRKVVLIARAADWLRMSKILNMSVRQKQMFIIMLTGKVMLSQNAVRNGGAAHATF